MRVRRRLSRVAGALRMVVLKYALRLLIAINARAICRIIYSIRISAATAAQGVGYER